MIAEGQIFGKLKISIILFFMLPFLAQILHAEVHAQSTEVSSFSILATGKIDIDKHVEVKSGHIGVLKAGSIVSIDKETFLDDGISVIGDTVNVEKKSSVENVYYNILNNKGTVRQGHYTPLELPLGVSLPAFPAPSPNQNNKRLKKREDLTLQPGSYGRINVDKRATLFLTGGTYHIESISFGSESRLVFQGQTELIINNKIISASRVTIIPDPGSGLSASDMLIFVNGQDSVAVKDGSSEDKGSGDKGSGGKKKKKREKEKKGKKKNHDGGSRDDKSSADRNSDDKRSDDKGSGNKRSNRLHKASVVVIGKENTIKAGLYAPNGTIYIDKNSEIDGALIGKDVYIDKYVHVSLNSGFREPLPLVTITSPETLTTVGSSPITVTGTVNISDAIVTVNGVSAALNNGTFSVSGITLKEGSNIITVTAIDTDNNVGTAHATIYFDSTPPRVTISSPADGYVATSSPITVTGSIFDTVKGTVNEENATVQVNGVTASVSNKTFMVDELPLVEGNNVITAIAADQTGNTASTSINVTLDLTANKKIEMLSGNNQTGVIGSQLSEPLLVILSDADGLPAANKIVIFKVTQNNGQLSGDSGSGHSLAETTDANGVAFVLHTLGSTSGVGNNKVEATAVGFTGTVVFTASATEKPPHKINIGSGNNQRGAVNTPLPNPLVAVVTDDGHNVLKGVPVTFTISGGGGNIDGSDLVVVNTDSDGRATISFTLGPVEGQDNNQVTADFAGNTTGATVFRATGLAIGDPGDTKISGLVLDNSNIPIPGVTVRVEGTTRQGVTDEEGQFLIDSVPVGPLHLVVDGSTATVSGEYPVLSYEIDTVAGQNNTLGMPIYLLPLNTENTQYVGGSNDVVYTLENIPGFSLSVKANSVTFPDGSNEGFISVTQVHADKMPMEPPNGLQPRFIITIQPPGAVFDPPAPITIPNVDGLAPGDITEMYSFDHDMGQFVSIGTGTVSEDGTVIASDPGVGVIKAGWHCGGDPQTGGCLHNCPECWECDLPDCVCDKPVQNNQAESRDLGKCSYCDGKGKLFSFSADTPCDSNGDGIKDGQCDNSGNCFSGDIHLTLEHSGTINFNNNEYQGGIRFLPKNNKIILDSRVITSLKIEVFDPNNERLAKNCVESCRNLVFDYSLLLANPGDYQVRGTAVINGNTIFREGSFNVKRDDFIDDNILYSDNLRELYLTAEDAINSYSCVYALTSIFTGVGMVPDIANVVASNFCDWAGFGPENIGDDSVNVREEITYRWVNDTGYFPIKKIIYRETIINGETLPREIIHIKNYE